MAENGVKANNYPEIFEIKFSDILGRYLSAIRPIKAGEIIILEAPVAFGPPMKSELLCLGCCRGVTLSDSQFRCPGCHWPLCSADCEGRHDRLRHSEIECEILARHNVAKLLETYDDNQMKLVNEMFFPLRCLFNKITDPHKWTQIIGLESHNNLRKDIPSLWSRDQRVVDLIRDAWNINDFTEEEIRTVCGIIKVNCFGLGRQGIKGRSLFAIASMMSHDCCPNARASIHPKTYVMTVRALRDIKRGEMITTSYVDYILGTLKRRQQLHRGKFFWCTCRRCSDPTEFGTYCSAIKCNQCSNGIILSTDPLDQNADWKCRQCGYSVSGNTMLVMLGMLFDELDNSKAINISFLEQYLEKYKTMLGDNHYLILLAKYNLCQMYNLSTEFSENLLRKREQYCRDVLKVMNVLKPGLSLVRGTTMYDLHIPLVTLAQSDYQRNRISKSEYCARLEEAVELLKESQYILSLDAHEPHEQNMARMARTALAAIKQLLMKCE